MPRKVPVAMNRINVLTVGLATRSSNKQVSVKTTVKCVYNIFIDRYQQRRQCTKSNKVMIPRYANGMMKI